MTIRCVMYNKKICSVIPDNSATFYNREVTNIVKSQRCFDDSFKRKQTNKRTIFLFLLYKCTATVFATFQISKNEQLPTLKQYNFSTTILTSKHLRNL